VKKERPIIFSTPMVEAILEGRKTMTRRVIVPQPKALSTSEQLIIECGILKRIWRGVMSLWETKIERKSKYNIGDILWVRETTAIVPCGDERGIQDRVIYKAGRLPNDFSKADGDKWIPSIHMKRTSARIFLEVVSVRVERLREITGEDKVAEGFCCCSRSYPCAERERCEKPCFMKTWDNLNAKRGEYGWKDNPWVWVIEFRRVKK
jgi:hypothetical protein